MKCHKCVEENKKSCVYPGMTTSTSMAWTRFYYDEDGKEIINKDPNTYITNYTCSNRHRFRMYTQEGEEPEIMMDRS